MRFKAIVSGMVLVLLGNGAFAFDGGSDPTLPRRPSEPSSSSGGSDDCNPVAAAIIGGIFGALINEKNRAQGAAVGAGIATAGCLAINAVSRQTKTADVVESAYVAKNGTLPPAPRVDEYKAGFVGGNGVVSAGKELKTRSIARVVRGTSVPLQEIREEIRLDLTQANGGRVVTHSKVLSETGTPGSGEWVNDFTVTIPPGTQQGKYPMQLALYVNGQVVDRKGGFLQVADSGTAHWVPVAAR